MKSKNDQAVRDGLPGLMPRLWRYGMVLTRNSDEAAELAQATAERALQRSHQFSAETQLDRWCFTILASIWKNELRSRSVRRGAGLVPVEEAALTDAGPHADVNISARQVLSNMMSLPEAQRETMFLVYVEGYTYAEAAERLAIPVGTVMSRLARGRQRLNESME